jgi:hypothetical protein
MDMEMQKMILSEIAKLKKMPDLSKAIKEFQPQPDPMEEQLKQMQMQLLEAQIANEQAKAQQGQATAQLNMARIEEVMAKVEELLAKAGTEGAKARALNSGADMTDLDFLQKQEGTQFKQRMAEKDKDFELELGRKAADSLLSPDTPNAFPGVGGEEQPMSGINPMDGQNLGNGGKALVGMDTPQENLTDVLRK